MFHNGNETFPCKIKDGWKNFGKTGQYFGYVYIFRPWAVVLWDGDEDPSYFKIERLLLDMGRNGNYNTTGSYEYFK